MQSPMKGEGSDVRTTTRDEDLEAQCARYLPFAATASVVAWIPYAFLDAAIHPELPQLPWIRVGLSVVAAWVLLLVKFTRIARRKLALVHAVYLLVATGAVTGLVGAEPVYVGGYCMVLIMALLPPIPRGWTWGALTLSLVAFLATGLTHGMIFPGGRGAYSRNDLVTAVVISYLFVYLADRLRRRTWEKTVEIERDHARIDELLHNILPPPIVSEIKSQGVVTPRHYDEATVVFTDFVGFTHLAEQMPPAELVALLHRCFTEFDRVVTRHGLEKLKTIGDSYMYAAGVPVPSPTHAVDAVLAALEIRDAMLAIAAEREARGKPAWHIRVGVHSGPLVAGVVGERKFVYDVWGDTVNLASRMETSGAPDEVNVSAATARAVADFFALEARGPVLAKNKGLVEMFFVRGVRPELAAEDGRSPGPAFFARRAVLGTAASDPTPALLN